MGYAFLPIAIGWFVGGPLGGRLLHYFGEVRHAPEQLWFVVAGIGILTTLLMYTYNRVLGTASSTSK